MIFNLKFDLVICYSTFHSLVKPELGVKLVNSYLYSIADGTCIHHARAMTLVMQPTKPNFQS